MCLPVPQYLLLSSSFLSQVVKYSLVYIIVIAFLAALIVLRTCVPPVGAVNQLSDVRFTAALFRDRITFKCTVCQNI